MQIPIVEIAIACGSTCGRGRLCATGCGWIRAVYGLPSQLGSERFVLMIELKKVHLAPAHLVVSTQAKSVAQQRSIERSKVPSPVWCVSSGADTKEPEDSSGRQEVI